MHVAFFRVNENGERVRGAEDKFLGVSSRNEMEFGKNSRFIKTRAYGLDKKEREKLSGNDPYRHIYIKKRGGVSSQDPYDYFYTGISDSEIYNYMLSEEGFERLTGIQLGQGFVTTGREWRTDYLNTDYPQVNSYRARHLMDLYYSLPEGNKVPKRIILFEDRYPGTSYTAVTTPDEYRTVEMSTHKSGEYITWSKVQKVNRESGQVTYLDRYSFPLLNAGILRHEIVHANDFYSENTRAYDLSEVWSGSGLINRVRSSKYADRVYKNGGMMERITEFVEEYSYDDKDWFGRDSRDLLRSRELGSAYRAAFALMWHQKVMTYDRVTQVLTRAGFDASPSSLMKYMRDYGIDTKRLKR